MGKIQPDLFAFGGGWQADIRWAGLDIEEPVNIILYRQLNTSQCVDKNKLLTKIVGGITVC